MLKIKQPAILAKALKPLSVRLIPVLPRFGPPKGDDDEEDEEDDEDEKNKGKKKDGEATVSQKEHDRILKKVREDERVKAQETISQLRKDLDNALAGNTQNNTQLAELQSKYDALIATTKDGKVDAEALLEKYGEKFRKTADTAAAKNVEEMGKELQALREENKQNRLERLRSKLIDANGGPDSMIVELVNGETREEIEDSIETAKAAYDRVAGKGSKGKKSSNEDDEEDEDSDDEDNASNSSEDDDDGNTQDKSKTRRGKVPPELPEGSEGKPSSKGKAGSRTGSRLLQSVSSLTPTDFAARRNEIMQELRKREGSAGARPFSRQ